jgi:response regulator RpfG family c-di-GMP phosphodiesterase
MSKDRTKLVLKVMLADDDADDRFFFEKAILNSMIPSSLIKVENGAKLMSYLAETDVLPDVLFLDLNMPKKNGSECLLEIKADPRFAKLPVVIYSTSMHSQIADILYRGGAHFYIKKTDLSEMQKQVNVVLNLISLKRFERPERQKFILDSSSYNVIPEKVPG